MLALQDAEKYDLANSTQTYTHTHTPVEQRDGQTPCIMHTHHVLKIWHRHRCVEWWPVFCVCTCFKWRRGLWSY